MTVKDEMRALSYQLEMVVDYAQMARDNVARIESELAEYLTLAEQVSKEVCTALAKLSPQDPAPPRHAPRCYWERKGNACQVADADCPNANGGRHRAARCKIAPTPTAAEEPAPEPTEAVESPAGPEKAQEAQEALAPEETPEKPAAGEAGGNPGALRTCRRCGKAKPAGDFYKSHPGVCKECKKARAKAMKEEKEKKAADTAKCRACKKEKPRDRFRTTYSGGLSNVCMDCEAKKVLRAKKAEASKAPEPFYAAKRRAAEEKAARDTKEAF